MTSVDSSNYHSVIRREAQERVKPVADLTKLLLNAGIKEKVDKGHDVTVDEIREILNKGQL